MNPERSVRDLQSAQPESVCPLCGSGGTTISWQPLVFSYGPEDSAAELVVQAPARRCGACEFQYLDEVTERLKHEVICRHLGVLPPEDISRIRRRYAMTRSTFARATGLDEALLDQWESGLSIQTHAYDRYLRFLEHPENMRKLEKPAGTGTPGQEG